MTFGQALKQLMVIGEVKMGILANALGYDISYLSKWVSGSKLPSPKSAETLCDKIARYFSNLSSAQMQAEILVAFEMLDDSIPFETALADKLYTYYLSSKDLTPALQLEENNANLILGKFLSAGDAEKEIIDFYDSSTLPCAEGVLILPPSLLSSEFLIKANEACAREGSRKRLHLHQIIDIRDFSGDTDSYVRYVLKHLSLLSPIRVDYYTPSADRFSSSRNCAIILESKYANCKVCHPIICDENLHISTHNEAMASVFFRSSKAFLREQYQMTEFLDLYDDLSYSYAIHPLNKYIMPFMGPVRLGPEILDDFLTAYLDVPEMYEHHRKLHELTQVFSYSVATYMSTIIDYVNSGRIKMFDGVVTVSREDRKRHLLHLINEMETGRFLSMLVLDDNNPVLRRKDNALTVYLNDMMSFATSDGPNARSDLINFESPQFRQYLGTLYSHLEALPNNQLRKGKDAIDFLYGAVKLI